MLVIVQFVQDVQVTRWRLRLLSNWQPWRRIRKLAGLDDVRIHDLRHTYASQALALGQTLPLIGKLLGHTQVQTTARYAHLAADPVRRAAAEVANHVRSALNGNSVGDEL